MQAITLAMARAIRKRAQEMQSGSYAVYGYIKLRGEYVGVRILDVWEDGIRVCKLDGERANHPARVGSVVVLQNTFEELTALAVRYETQRAIAEKFAAEAKRLNRLAYRGLTFDELQQGKGRERSRNLHTGEFTREARR